MFTLERAHQLLRQQGLESDEDFEVHSASRSANKGGVSSNWTLLRRPSSDSPAVISPLSGVPLSGAKCEKTSPLRLVSAVVIGTAIGSLLGSLLS